MCLITPYCVILEVSNIKLKTVGLNLAILIQNMAILRPYLVSSVCNGTSRITHCYYSNVGKISVHFVFSFGLQSADYGPSVQHTKRGTVPLCYALNRGTVPLCYALSRGTVPLFTHSLDQPGE